MGYTIGFFADTHLGYESGTSVDPATGLNQRVRDGYDALKETVDAMVAAEVDLVIQGGDLFHVPKPTAVDVKFANGQLRRLADAEIPTVINTGNHDAPGQRGDGAAVLYVDDPSRGITSVATPYREINIADGLRLHVISHYGLAQEQRVYRS
jgi:DNA repair exonuclease